MLGGHLWPVVDFQSLHMLLLFKAPDDASCAVAERLRHSG